MIRLDFPSDLPGPRRAPRWRRRPPARDPRGSGGPLRPVSGRWRARPATPVAVQRRTAAGPSHGRRRHRKECSAAARETRPGPSACSSDSAAGPPAVPFPGTGEQFLGVEFGEDPPDLRGGAHLLDQVLQPIDGALTQRPATGGDRDRVPPRGHDWHPRGGATDRRSAPGSSLSGASGWRRQGPTARRCCVLGSHPLQVRPDRCDGHLPAEKFSEPRTAPQFGRCHYAACR